MIIVLISRKECNEQCNQCEKHGCMWMMHCWSIANFTQDIGLNQFRFSLKQHGPSHIVKVSLEIKHRRQQSIIFFVNHLAQSYIGSWQRSDVTRSIFCPNFCKLVTSILNLDLMNLYLKTCAWFNPIIRGMAILIANTSTTYHRDEWLGHTYAWQM